MTKGNEIPRKRYLESGGDKFYARLRQILSSSLTFSAQNNTLLSFKFANMKMSFDGKLFLSWVALT